MASALARGWGDPVVCSDVDAERARALAGELGGEAVDDERAGRRVGRRDRALPQARPARGRRRRASTPPARSCSRCSAACGWSSIRARLSRRPRPTASCRTSRSRSGAARSGSSTTTPVTRQAFAEVRALLERVGEVVVLPEAQLDIVTATAGVAPAYVARHRRGLDRRRGAARHARRDRRAARRRLAGGRRDAAARARHGLAGVRRAVTSPGGVTAAGLRALERGGLRTAMQDALDAVLERSSMTRRCWSSRRRARRSPTTSRR